mgnify:CR=1 FL=1
MAFQDSCGGIVLDAILTDAGRRHMANGTFRVTKFALGDDEVDYALRSTASVLYKNPRIESLPVFEAFNAENATINYGLVDYIRPDVFYIPDLQGLDTYINTAAIKSGYYYHLAVNDETAAKLKTALGSDEMYMLSNEVVKTKLIVGSGITSDETKADKLGKERFLLNLGMYDSYYAISCDSRFVENILTQPPNSFLKNDTADNIYSRLAPLETNIKVSLGPPVANYDSYRVAGVDNQIYKWNSSSSNKLLPHSGSRSTITAMNFNIYDHLCGTSTAAAADEYYIFGETGELLFGGSDKYDYIDTTIYIQGLSSNARMQAILRIVRYAGT